MWTFENTRYWYWPGPPGLVLILDAELRYPVRAEHDAGGEQAGQLQDEDLDDVRDGEAEVGEPQLQRHVHRHVAGREGDAGRVRPGHSKYFLK